MSRSMMGDPLDWATHRLSQRLSSSTTHSAAIYEHVAAIDGVKTAFTLTSKLAPPTLKRLTQALIVTSTGASNRIEGNRLSDQEVEALYSGLQGKRQLDSRDAQEVAGYWEVLQRIIEAHAAMPLSEGLILQLHRDMLRYSDKDVRQRGQYKFGPNRVEAKDAQGRVVGVLFDPTPPHLVQKEMSELLVWYSWATATAYSHPLLCLANFIFEYLAIHPFQDGNGRSSRLLTNLLLLQQGYFFARLCSHEKCIEARQADYYLALQRSQAHWKTAHEQLTPWLLFFLETVREQAQQAVALLRQDHLSTLLSSKQQLVWEWAKTRQASTFSRQEAFVALSMPRRTLEDIIKKLVDLGALQPLGAGRARRYRLKQPS